MQKNFRCLLNKTLSESFSIAQIGFYAALNYQSAFQLHTYFIMFLVNQIQFFLKKIHHITSQHGGLTFPDSNLSRFWFFFLFPLNHTNLPNFLFSLTINHKLCITQLFYINNSFLYQTFPGKIIFGKVWGSMGLIKGKNFTKEDRRARYVERLVTSIHKS